MMTFNLCPRIDVDETIIAEVKKYPEIYDPTRPDHRQSSAIRVAWSKVGEVVGWPGRKCQSRWKNIRYKYRTILLSKTNGKSPKSKWKFAKSLRFLDRFIRCVDIEYDMNLAVFFFYKFYLYKILFLKANRTSQSLGR